MARDHRPRSDPGRAAPLQAIKTVHRPDEIPAFADEAEEAAFWATHGLAGELLERMEPPPEDELPPARPRTRPVAIRFDDDVLRRLKALARKKQKGYQTLLKEFVVERLYEEEKREGLVGSDRTKARLSRA